MAVCSPVCRFRRRTARNSRSTLHSSGTRTGMKRRIPRIACSCTPRTDKRSGARAPLGALMSLHRRPFGIAAGLLLALAANHANAQTIRQYQFAPRADGKAYEIVLKQVPRPSPGAHDVLVRIHATSINGGYDVEMRDRQPGGSGDLTGGIPFADGAGEVVAIGGNVTRFKVGDRVVGIFMPRWLGGDRTVEGMQSSRGGNAG